MLNNNNIWLLFAVSGKLRTGQIADFCGYIANVPDEQVCSLHVHHSGWMHDPPFKDRCFPVLHLLSPAPLQVLQGQPLRALSSSICLQWDQPSWQTRVSGRFSQAGQTQITRNQLVEDEQLQLYFDPKTCVGIRQAAGRGVPAPV